MIIYNPSASGQRTKETPRKNSISYNAKLKNTIQVKFNDKAVMG